MMDCLKDLLGLGTEGKNSCRILPKQGKKSIRKKRKDPRHKKQHPRRAKDAGTEEGRTGGRKSEGTG